MKRLALLLLLAATSLFAQSTIPKARAERVSSKGRMAGVAPIAVTSWAKPGLATRTRRPRMSCRPERGSRHTITWGPKLQSPRSLAPKRCCR